MSNRAVAWAFEVDGLTAAQKFLLVALADYADESDSCYPGQATLAERVCSTRETVSRNLSRLEKLGAIRRERRYRQGGYRTSDRFIVNVGWSISCDAESHDFRSRDSKSRDSERILCDVDDGSYVTQNGGQKGTVSRTTRGTTRSMSEVADATPRHDVQKLLDLLDSEITANGGKPNGHLKRNRDAMRLLIDRDGKTIEQVEACIRWCQASEFWRSNILSASKLREKYDQLRLQALAQRQQQGGRRQGTHLGVIQRLQQEESDAGGGSGAIAPVRQLG